MGINGMGQEEDPAGESSSYCHWFAVLPLVCTVRPSFQELSAILYSHILLLSGNRQAMTLVLFPQASSTLLPPSLHSQCLEKKCLKRHNYSFTATPVGSWLPDKLHVTMNQ